MKFNFGLNKNESLPRSGGEQRERPEDVVPARPELDNQSQEDTFSKENEGKNPRKEFVPVEEIADNETGEDEFIDTLDAKLAASKQPQMDKHEGPFETSADIDPEFYENIGRMDREYYERITNRIVRLLEEHPENFSELLQRELELLSPTEAQRVFEAIEKMNLVTKTEDYALDNEGNKIDTETDKNYQAHIMENRLNKRPNEAKADYFDEGPTDMKQVWDAFKRDLAARDPELLRAMEEAEANPGTRHDEYRRMWSNMTKRFDQFRERYSSLKKKSIDREAIRSFLDETNDSINEANSSKDLLGDESNLIKTEGSENLDEAA